MATGGGSIAFKGLLGIVLTNTEGNVLLTCYGQPVEYDLLSFQSEACVFFVTIPIFFLIAERYNKSIKEHIAITSKILLFTDSRSTIKKIITMKKYPTTHLKRTMDLE